MFSYNPQTDIVIYGNNRLTDKLCVFYRNMYKIRYIIAHTEAELARGNLYGIPVVGVGPDYLQVKADDYKIVVANNNIAAYYLFKSMTPFDQYLPAAFFEFETLDMALLAKYIGNDSQVLAATVSKMKNGKKGVVLHGNCQMRLVQNYLLSSQKFCEDYVILSIPRVFEYTDDSLWVIESPALWDNTDVLIHHIVGDNNRFGAALSSNGFIARLHEGAVHISIANLWFSGYFPQIVRNQKNVLTALQQSGLFPYGDKNIDLFYQRGQSFSSIMQTIGRLDFYSAQAIETNIEKDFSVEAEREQHIDVKMLDFVKANYKKRLLFHSPNHPTHYLMQEETRRLLARLGIRQAKFDKEFWNRLRWDLRGQDVPIYPSVAQYFGFDLSQMLYLSNSVIYDKFLTFEEWCLLYYNTL